MKKILFILSFIVSLASFGQGYLPGKHVVVNDAIFPAQKTPLNGRTMYNDTLLFLYRDFQNTSEVLTNLTSQASRFGASLICVHQGGTLNGSGSFIGGVRNFYWFRNGLADSNLVKFPTDSVALRLSQDSMWRVNDSIIAFTINGGPTRTVLVRGTAAGGINSLTLNAPSILFTTPITFANTGGAWSGTMTLTNQNTNFFFAGPSIGSPGPPAWRQISTTDLPIGIPNGNLQNSSIGVLTGSTGTDINWSASSVALGGSIQLNIPNAGLTARGLLLPLNFNIFNNKVDSTSQSNDTVYDWRSGSKTFRYVITGGGGGGVTNFLFTPANGFTGSVATSTTTPNLTIGTSITGLLFGNGTAMAAATVNSPLTYSAGSLGLLLANGNGTTYNTGTQSIDLGTYLNQNTFIKGTKTVHYGFTIDSTARIFLRSEALVDTSTYVYQADSILKWTQITSANPRSSGYFRVNLPTTNDAVVSAQVGKVGSTVYGAPLLLMQSSDSSLMLRANSIQFNPSDILTSHPNYVWTIIDTVKGTGHWAAPTGGGSGTVSNFTAGTLSPLFTTSVATATTTPALTFALSNAAANTAFGNFTGSAATPTFGKLPLAAMAIGTANSLIGYDGSGNPSGVTVSTGLSLSAGVLTATGSGGGYGPTDTIPTLVTHTALKDSSNFYNYNYNSAFFPSGDTVIAFGHSYVFGANASTPTLRYSSLFCSALGAIEKNLGVSGSTVMKQAPVDYQGAQSFVERMTQIPAYGFNKKFLWFDGGLNDAGQTAAAYTTTNYIAAWDSVFNYVINTLGWPREKIGILGVEFIGQAGLTYYGTVTGNAAPTYARMRQFDSCNRAEALKWKINWIPMYDKIRYNDSTLLGGTGTVHPTDSGYAYMAKHMLQKLGFGSGSSLSGSGAANSVAYWSNSTTLTGNTSKLSYNNTGLGIGQASALYPLDIVGSVNSLVRGVVTNTSAGTGAAAAWQGVNDVSSLFTMGQSSSTYNAVVPIGTDASFLYGNGSGGVALVADKASAGGNIRFATGGQTERMRLDNSGNLMIGKTSSPNGLLDVNGIIASESVFQAINTTAAYQWRPTASPTSGAFSVGFSIPGGSATSNLIFSRLLSTTWSSAMTLYNSTGNLGINTPTEDGFTKMQVTGTVKITDTLKLPNIARKLLDSTNFKPTVVDVSGNLFKTDWATFGSGGVTTVGAFSGSSIANGASISGSTITFGPADATNPGMITTGSQTLAGAKIWTGQSTFPAATTGAASILLTSSAGVNVTSPTTGQLWWNGTNLNFRTGSTTVDLLAGGGGATNIGSTQNATNYSLTSSSGTGTTLLTATSSLAGLLDTSRAKFVDSLKTGTKTFNLYAANGLSASTVIADSFYLGGPLIQPTTISFGTNHNLTFNYGSSVFVRTDGTRTYSENITATGSRNYEFAYTNPAGVFSLGTAYQVDTLNNVFMGGAAMTSATAATVYSTLGSNSFVQASNLFTNAQFKTVVNLTSNTTLNIASFHTILVDATSGSVTITLPAASSGFLASSGIEYVVQKVDASANTVTISRAGSDLINGSATQTLTIQYQSRTLQAATSSSWAMY